MKGDDDHEFWQKMTICLGAQVQVIETYKIGTPPVSPGRTGEGVEREFWQKLATCLEAQAQTIKKHKMDSPMSPAGRVFTPLSAKDPKREIRFWSTIRRNLLSQVATIKEDKIGGSATVKLNKRHRHKRRPRLDAPPGKRT